jgi:hypothetical protein
VRRIATSPVGAAAKTANQYVAEPRRLIAVTAMSFFASFNSYKIRQSPTLRRLIYDSVEPWNMHVRLNGSIEPIFGQAIVCPQPQTSRPLKIAHFL